MARSTENSLQSRGKYMSAKDANDMNNRFKSPMKGQMLQNSGKFTIKKSNCYLFTHTLLQGVYILSLLVSKRKLRSLSPSNNMDES